MVFPHHNQHCSRQSLHNFSMKPELRDCHTFSLSFRIASDIHYHRMHKLAPLYYHSVNISHCIGRYWFWVWCKRQYEPSLHYACEWNGTSVSDLQWATIDSLNGFFSSSLFHARIACHVFRICLANRIRKRKRTRLKLYSQTSGLS